MRTLPLGDTLALYINRADLAELGLTPTTKNIADLARKALAERGTPGDAGLSLEIYPGGDSQGDLLVFCQPLERTVTAFAALADAIAASKRLCAVPSDTHVHSALHRTDEGEWLLELRAAPRVLHILRAEAAEFGVPVRADASYLSEHSTTPIPQDALSQLSNL